MFAYCGNNPVNFEDPTGELTQGQIHNLVLEEIIKEKKKEGRKTLSCHRTCIYYNCVDFWGGWGFCDLYDVASGEVWELKKESSSYTCSTEYATRQLKNYVSGRLKNMPNLKLKSGGRLLTGKSSFTYTDSSGTYNILYWEQGNGILRYAYIKTKRPSPDSAQLLLGFALGGFSKKSNGGSNVVSFCDDLDNAA